MRIPKALLEVDLYALLDVPQNASTEQLRRAYRREARCSHPDLNRSADAHRRMSQLNAAAKILLDPVWRQVYDAHRSYTASHGAASHQTRHRAQSEPATSGAKHAEPTAERWSRTAPTPPYSPLSDTEQQFVSELRGPAGRVSLYCTQYACALSVRQQWWVTSLLLLLGVGLMWLAQPRAH